MKEAKGHPQIPTAARKDVQERNKPYTEQGDRAGFEAEFRRQKP
jgi:hypothetical protein